MSSAKNAPTSRRTVAAANGSLHRHGSALEDIFGRERTEVKVSEQEPTCELRWHRGRLQQLWNITECHMHYSGDHYNHSTYHKRTKWRDVPGAPNAPDQRPAE